MATQGNVVFYFEHQSLDTTRNLGDATMQDVIDVIVDPGDNNLVDVAHFKGLVGHQTTLKNTFT